MTTVGVTRQGTQGRRGGQDILNDTRERVDPALRAAVDQLPRSVRHIVGYHLGWWNPDGKPVSGSTGKAFRPALVLLCAQAVGGQAATGPAVPAAVAVELVHNFSLLHDDVMDRDLTRRHRPTAWTVFGVADAILGGDALLALATRVLAGTPAPAGTTGTRLLADAVIALCEGQQRDVAFERRSDVSLTECTVMVRDKTGALLACSCALGALYGGAPPDAVAEFHQFGLRLGMAFQLVDDLLGIWGDPEVTGKPVFSDLASRKKSLPVVMALGSKTAAGREFAARYSGAGMLEPDQLRRLAGLVEEAGGRAWAQAQADEHLGAAATHLRRAVPEPARRADLLALGGLITRRTA